MNAVDASVCACPHRMQQRQAPKIWLLHNVPQRQTPPPPSPTLSCYPRPQHSAACPRAQQPACELPVRQPSASWVRQDIRIKCTAGVLWSGGGQLQLCKTPTPYCSLKSSQFQLFNVSPGPAGSFLIQLVENLNFPETFGVWVMGTLALMGTHVVAVRPM